MLAGLLVAAAGCEDGAGVRLLRPSDAGASLAMVAGSDEGSVLGLFGPRDADGALAGRVSSAVYCDGPDGATWLYLVIGPDGEPASLVFPGGYRVQFSTTSQGMVQAILYDSEGNRLGSVLVEPLAASVRRLGGTTAAEAAETAWAAAKLRWAAATAMALPGVGPDGGSLPSTCAAAAYWSSLLTALASLGPDADSDAAYIILPSNILAASDPVATVLGIAAAGVGSFETAEFPVGTAAPEDPDSGVPTPAPINLTGRWTFTVQGKVVGASITQSGSAFSVQYDNVPHSYPGTIQGNAVTIRINDVTTSGVNINVVMVGTVSADGASMSGTGTGEGYSGTMPWSAVRS